MPSFWPDQLDYFEAVQAPEHCFADPELRRARVTVDDLGMPRPWSGNFASVYQFQAPDGRRTWAVKCFKHPIPDLNVRYQEISRCLRRADIPLTVVFEYLEQGIQVRGEWFPIVKMDWVEGRTLRQFVADRLAEPHILRRLFDLWLKVETWLKSAGLAHGDLQHGNLLLVSATQRNFVELKLIDYDGMWIPGLAGYPSHECGHSAYQHPLRERDRAYNPQIDRFPLLVIACALRCLSRPEARSLWQRYDNGDNLLFAKADFQDPANSPLLRELWETRNAELRTWVAWIVSAALAPLDATPVLRELLADGRLNPVTEQTYEEVAELFQNRAPIRSPVSSPVMEFASLDSGSDRFAQPEMTDHGLADGDLIVGDPDGSLRDRRRSGRLASFWPRGICAVIALLLTAAIGRHFHGRSTVFQVPVAKRERIPDRATAPANNDAKAIAQIKPPAIRPAEPEAPAAAPDPFIGTRPGQVRRDNGLQLPLAWCPQGEFVRGDPIGGQAADPNRAPQSTVTLTQGFWLGTCEVTQRQWMQIIDTQPWRGSDDVRPGDEFPVVFVNWEQATDFCRQLTTAERKAGRLPDDCEYVLPTDAQWEYGCRAGTRSQFCFGDDPAHLADFAWYVDNAFHVNEPFAHEVGKKRPNAWGLYDMHGNVVEICRDGFVDRPPGGRDPYVPFSGTAAVARGGSCDDPEEKCRSACRDFPSNPGAFLGFRVALVRHAADDIRSEDVDLPDPDAERASRESDRGKSGRVTGVPSGVVSRGAVTSRRT